MIGLPSAIDLGRALVDRAAVDAEVAALVEEAGRSRLHEPAPRVALVGVRRGQVGVEVPASRRGSASSERSASGIQHQTPDAGVGGRPVAVVAVVAEEPAGPDSHVDDDRGPDDRDEREEPLDVRRANTAARAAHADRRAACRRPRPRSGARRPRRTRRPTTWWRRPARARNRRPSATAAARCSGRGPAPSAAIAARSSGNRRTRRRAGARVRSRSISRQPNGRRAPRA